MIKHNSNTNMFYYLFNWLQVDISYMYTKNPPSVQKLNLGGVIFFRNPLWNEKSTTPKVYKMEIIQPTAI